MTTGANALLTWFRKPLAKIRTTTDRMTEAAPRQYRTHARRTCYRGRQEGHYARECPRTATPKPIETKVEKMQSLLRSMTPSERAQFKREISPRMITMQTHLKTMSTTELEEFKRRITPNTTQIFVAAPTNKKTSTNPLSRETSPQANQMLTGLPLSRETSPHPTKSLKKLAQALKKRAKYDIEQKTHTSFSDHSRKVFAAALRRTTKTPQPNPSIKTLTDALKQSVEQKSERPTRSYTERIRELIGSPEQCEKCGKEHPTRFCMERFKKFRKSETTPLPVTDDDATNSDTLCDSEESEDDET